MINLIEDGFDIGVRFGVLTDNRMVARRLSKNKRVVCAAPEYLKKYGAPKTPQDLSQHRCITMVRSSQALTQWHFKTAGGETSVSIHPALSTNNGAQLREWAVAGHGIVLKSFWDVKADISSGKLVLLLEDYTQDFEASGLAGALILMLSTPVGNICLNGSGRLLIY